MISSSTSSAPCAGIAILGDWRGSRIEGSSFTWIIVTNGVKIRDLGTLVPGNCIVVRCGSFYGGSQKYIIQYRIT